MCGIAGIININNSKSIPESLIVAMCDEIRHRGPDGEGFLFSDDISPDYVDQLKQKRPDAHLTTVNSARQVHLGHRRLSIIDLSTAAAQPMTDATESFHVVFNGEIYNHAELRKELQQKGFSFKTDHSDTEVILNSYAAWGIDCISRFRGMFAFCLWDMSKDLFWLVRDRMGIKPLYYTISDGNLYFASEIKAILKSPVIQKRINYTGLYDYLSFFSVAPPETMFEGIYKIPAAHLIKIERGSISSPQRYWEMFSDNNVRVSGSEEALCTELLQRFTESVSYRREADVPYGVLLSGGVDSSANLAMLTKLTKKPVKAFSVGFDNKNKNYKNEFEYSRKVAKLFNADYHEIMLSQQHFMEFLPRMVYHQDEPIADTACIPLYYVSKLAKDNGVTVVMGGEGSDELFIGYELWRRAHEFHSFFEKLPARPALILAKLLLGLPYLKNKRTYYRNWIDKSLKEQQIFWGGTELRSENQKQRIITDSFNERLNTHTSYDVIEKYYNRFLSTGQKSQLNWMSYLDLNYRLPELLLARLDKMTMAASVEGRVPFLDHKLVEWSMSINPSIKIKNKTEKYILKKALEPVLPHDIIYRPKAGFPVPMDALFSEELKGYAREVVGKFNSEEKIFSQTYLAELFSPAKGNELWNVLNLALWWQKLIKRN